MTEEEYLTTQTQLVALTQLLPEMRLEEMVSAAERADAFAPIFHPSEWKRGHKRLEAIKDLARAALTFKREAIRFRERMLEIQAAEARR